jgi:hypothetical protein
MEKCIEVPGGVAEEAMEPAPVADADLAAGEDDLGDERWRWERIHPVTISEKVW